MSDNELTKICREIVKKDHHTTILTGAGISAESGIPTFRGPEGYWTIGSKEYYPEEMATNAMFRKDPFEVWKWYLYRRAVCNNVEPNPGHLALAQLEKLLKNRFHLITQNVDGLHLRAGNTLENTFQIHGNINYMRCSKECCKTIYPMPEEIPVKPVTKDFAEDIFDYLRCPECNSYSRPHVLWFDECYDEEYFRFNSSLEIATRTDVLITIGTSGATNLPNHIVQGVIAKNGLVVDINPKTNPFAELAIRNGGYFLAGASGKILPKLLELINL